MFKAPLTSRYMQGEEIMFDHTAQPYEDNNHQNQNENTNKIQASGDNGPQDGNHGGNQDGNHGGNLEKQSNNSGNQPEPMDLFGHLIGQQQGKGARDSNAPRLGPSPSWRVTDSDDDLSVAICAINRAHVRLAKTVTPDMDDCVSDVQTRLCVRLGLPEFRALTLVEIGLMFERFPSLAELGETGAYSLEIWRLVSEGLAAVSDEVAPIVEPLVLTAISPTVRNQAMLGSGTIRRRIKEIVSEHEPSARPRDPDDNPPPDESGDGVDEGGAEQPALRLDIDERADETTEFFLSLPKLEAAELTAALDNVRLKENCSRAEALMKLIRGETKAEVSLNLYRRVDLPDSKIWAAGGWLTPMATEEWLKRVTHIQAPGKANNKGYAPTPIVRASVEGRDGTCRFPGCEVPAHKCQLDHVQRYNHRNPEKGGATDTSNLHCLCAKHHNAKTTGAWDVTIDEDGLETWTSHGDGHTVMTTPNGPLGRETFRHRAVRRTLALAEYNRRRQQRDLEDEPPF
ncbi:HNH endonuclease signature motif containing protein [uncultured Corynebacterium sp.]|uniref:HNH endonuclease signature motif containing protein n=1 Tax=uncultured Corynebacterium sp. TaxID=159447 RepID=UPI0025ED6DD2|nr:HNH endonuclease signature motif containing protein [uncultured Corynebacterium sp.]